MGQDQEDTWCLTELEQDKDDVYSYDLKEQDQEDTLVSDWIRTRRRWHVELYDLNRTTPRGQTGVWLN